VLRQSYQNWEYVIVNNCSTDRTPEIAERYALQDARIRVHHNQHFVGMVENENIAFKQTSPASKYSKMVHADDWLYPECLSRMIERAESCASIAIVGAYGFNGTKVLWNQLEPNHTIVPGREICRRTLLGGFYVFGSPSSLLFRSDLLRDNQPFFDPSFFAQFSDNEACFRVLQANDFGFVHEVLTFSREHQDSMTSSIAQTAFNGLLPGQLRILARYGPVYLSETEYARRTHEIFHRYYQFLGRYPFRLGDSRFRNLHLGALGSANHSLSLLRLAKASISQFVRPLMNPRHVAKRVLETVTKSSHP
jgi:glycosyltransferase involved in cell wall biosynthesis